MAGKFNKSSPFSGLENNAPGPLRDSTHPVDVADALVRLANEVDRRLAENERISA
jgi:hypothetical protein